MAIKSYFNHNKKNKDQQHGECIVICDNALSNKEIPKDEEILKIIRKSIAFDPKRKDWQGYNG